MSNFFRIGDVIINQDKIINVSKKLIKHDKKELTDDNGEPYNSNEQYTLAVKQVEGQTSCIYYDSRKEQDEAFEKLVKLLVFNEEVRG